MLTFLLTNDDGADSPFLPPVIACLSALGRVRVVVPDAEQSWKAKAMTRYGRLTAQRRPELGAEAFSVSGTPSDCVNLGVFQLFDGPPDWVLSGVNLGFNAGASFVINSGTVGGALEGALCGLPAAAFSTYVPPRLFQPWATERRFEGPEAEAILASTSARTAELAGRLVRRGLPAGAMLVNVNFPGAVTPQTPVRWVPLQDNRYGSLFVREGDAFVHRFNGQVRTVPGSASPSDREVVQAGEISATALSLAGLTVHVPEGYDG
jgi:5'-nucleotidase